jgi:ABC-type transporter MlaC component
VGVGERESEREREGMMIDINIITTTKDDPVKYKYQSYQNSEPINSTQQTVHSM